MQADRPDRARAAIAEATEGGGELVRRDDVLLRAIEVGLARRADDAPALVLAWHRARESVLHAGIDLYSLMPLEELVVAAARLRESGRLRSHLAQAWELLNRLGDPPLWSVRLHWSAVQAAILTERPSDLAPHAAALVRASEHNRLAFVLAAAGRAWLSVLAQSFEVGTVESAARGLASVGLTWDGSRLAGHAAARTEERKDMARLLACARDLHPGLAASAASERGAVGLDPAARAPASSVRDETGLSAREREIARLVLEGKTYREIGETVFISPRTAEHHIARIRSRLGASTRSELLTLLRVALDGPEASGD
jgi:DNA-binding CsgD family transcriptional regulator